MSFIEKINPKNWFKKEKFLEKAMTCFDEVSSMDIQNIEQAVEFREKTLRFYKFFSKAIKRKELYYLPFPIQDDKINSWVENDIKSFYFIEKKALILAKEDEKPFNEFKLFKEYTVFLSGWSMLRSELEDMYDNKVNCSYEFTRKQKWFIQDLTKSFSNFNLQSDSFERIEVFFNQAVFNSSNEKLLLKFLSKKSGWLEDWLNLVEKNKIINEMNLVSESENDNNFKKIKANRF